MAKAKKINCVDCTQQLHKDEIALCKKLLGEDTTDFMCLDCFALYLGCERTDLETKIAEFKEQGCTLFL